MKCYQHHNHDAIGICKTCGKALCPDCAVDQKFALTCKGACEEQAKSYFKINENARNTYSSQRRFWFLMPVFFFFLGIIFMGTGLQHAPLWNFASIAGGTFTVFGTIMFIINYKWRQNFKHLENPSVSFKRFD